MGQGGKTPAQGVSTALSIALSTPRAQAVFAWRTISDLGLVVWLSSRDFRNLMAWDQSRVNPKA